MKLKNTLALGFGLTFALSAQSYAAETVSNPINEDLFFSNGVQIQNVSQSSEGVGSVALEGSGSLTIGSQASGGFPRVSIPAGTTITSTRAWPAETVPKTSWDGQLSAPGSGRLPGRDELEFPYATSLGNLYEAVDAYVWGLGNETFSFGSPVRFVFPVDEQDGQRLWYAAANGNSWSVKSAGDYCIVDSGLCYLELSSMNGLALVKQAYETCPASSILNGSVGSAPNCIVTCDDDYYVDEEGNECLADSFFGDSEGNANAAAAKEDNETSLELEDLSDEQQEELYSFADEHEIDPLAILAQMPGNVRLRESGMAWQRYLPEYSELTEEELAAVRHVNSGYLARNPRSTEEQIAGGGNGKDPLQVRHEETSFMNYLLQMRESFAREGGVNTEVGSDDGEVTEENEEDVSENFHSSGGKMLPSTGPGLFIMIAIVGFCLMLFGGIRRN